MRKFARNPRCFGTVEDHRRVALDVRELIRKRVFEYPTGSTFYLDVRYPWLRTMRVDGASIDLRLATGRTVTVLLAWTHR